MFRYRNFKNVGYNNSETPAVYSYETTEDTIAQVSVSGYFSDPRAEIREGDLIIARCTDGSTTLTALNGDSVIAMPSAGEVARVVDDVIKQNITRPTNIAFCGDSITRDGYGVVSSTQSGYNDWGWVAWFRRNLNKSYSINPDDIFAVASQGTNHLVNTQLPQLISSGCGVCITMIGTNDLGLSVDIIGNLETYYDALKQNNIVAVAMPILPHNSPDSLTDAEAQEASRVNRYLSDRAKVDTNMYYLSALDVFTDYSTGDAVSAYLRDGIHTSKAGAKVLGDSIASKFNDVFSGAVDAEYGLSGNAYNATINPNGNILTNPYMTGTGGALANGATGSVATGCLVYRSSPSSTFGLVASKEIINNLPYQVVTLSGNGDTTIAIIEQSVTLPEGWEEGDVIRGRVDIITDFSGVSYFAVGMWCAPNVGYDGSRTSANGDYPELNYGVWSAEVSIPAGATTAKLSIYAETKNATALSGTIKVSKMFIERT